MTTSKLPRKEAELFKNLVACYETKQYKKGLKVADSILKKYPSNGETLAMKGIIVNCMGKKNEALELVRSGLRNDVKSAVCWHVFGLVHRSDNNYKEAAKCYLNALKIDSDNQNILRDLSWLQIQTRDYTGFLQTRKRLLELKPSSRSSWIAYAVACNMKGEHEACFEALEKYFESFENASEKPEPYEESELRLFQNKVLESAAKYQEALAHIDKVREQVLDRHEIRIQNAKLFLLSELWDQSLISYRDLVNEEPDNMSFHSGLQASLLKLPSESSQQLLSNLFVPVYAMSLSDQAVHEMSQLYEGMASESRTVKKIVLALKLGKTDFNKLLESFISDSLGAGVPSLPEDLLDLALVSRSGSQRIRANCPSELANHETIKQSLLIVDEILSRGNLDPMVHLWGLYSKAELRSACGEQAEALAILDECLQHTPTAVDIYLKKAEILRKAGDFNSAALVAEECRLLDLQDRYLNNCATKYLLKADKVKEAQDTIAIFTKHDGDPEKTLFELQCSWYELETAESYARQKLWKQAISKFSAVKDHVKDQYNDLFDFHSYCIRKSTLRAYQDAFHVSENSFSHPNYQRAVSGALGIYVHLIDCPEDIDGLGHLSAAERKKERAKMRKKRSKNKEGDEEEASEDKDSDMGDCLKEATDWCRSVESVFHLSSCQTLSLIAEVYLRKNRPIQVLRALVCGYLRSKTDPDINIVLLKYLLKLKSKKFGTIAEGLLSVIKSVLADVMNIEVSNPGIQKFSAGYTEYCRQSCSFPHVIAAFKIEQLMGKKVDPESHTLLDQNLNLLEDFDSDKSLSFLKFLKENYPNEEFVSKFERRLNLQN